MALNFPIVIEGLVQALRKRGLSNATLLRQVAGQAVAMGVDTVEDLRAWAYDTNNGLPVDALRAVAQVLPGRDQAAIGPYRILAHLASGGMGSAWLAAPPDDDERLVVVKTLRRDLSSQETVASRFVREARITQSIHHHHVVDCLDSGQAADGSLYLVLEFVAGGDLRQLLHQGRKLDELHALGVIHQSALGLEAAHALKLVHRDIKPSNLFIGSDGVIKVADFGLARSTVAGRTQLTQQGALLGTPTYMSPEQATGEDEVDIRTDIYALGITLFECLAGVPPYQDRSPLTLMHLHVEAPIPDLRAVRPELDPLTLEVVTTCMAKKPKGRYRDPGLLAKACAKVLKRLGGEPGTPLPAALVVESLPKAASPARYRTPLPEDPDSYAPASVPAGETKGDLPTVTVGKEVDALAETRRIGVTATQTGSLPPPAWEGDWSQAIASDWVALIGEDPTRALLLFARRRLLLGKMPANPVDLCLRYYPTPDHLHACMQLSRCHVQVSACDRPCGIQVEDVGSTNGTTLDGQALPARTPRLVPTGRPATLTLGAVMDLNLFAVPQRGPVVASIGPIGADGSASCGLETATGLDALVLTRPHNRPGLVYAMVLRRLGLGPEGSDLVLGQGASCEIARFNGRWIQRPQAGDPWQPLIEGGLLLIAGRRWLVRLGGYDLYDDLPASR